MKKLFAVISLSVIMFCSGCEPTSTEVHPPDGPIAFEVLNFSPGTTVNGEDQTIAKCKFSNSAYQWEKNVEDSLSKVELEISDQDSFGSLVICNSNVAVDFDEEFVIAGVSQVWPSLIYGSEISVEFKDGKVLYNVELIETVAAQPMTVTHMTKISKEYLGYPVEFNLYWKVWE